MLGLVISHMLHDIFLFITYSEILSRQAKEACGENFLLFPFDNHSRKEPFVSVKAEESELSVKTDMGLLGLIVAAILRPPLVIFF